MIDAMIGLRYRIIVGRRHKHEITGVVVKESAKTVLLKLDPPDEGHLKVHKGKKRLIPCR